MSDFEKKLAAFAAVTNNDLFDPDYNGGEWLTEAVETQETLADFESASKNWAERSVAQKSEIAGLPYVCWSKVQVARGQARRSMAVIDFGDRRIAIDADLGFYL